MNADQQTAAFEMEIIKAKARGAVLRAVKAGKLIRPSTCSRCSVDPGTASDGRSRIQGHHETYDDPLNVVWLCYWCHQLAHGRDLARPAR